jgi:hypothetical protein
MIEAERYYRALDLEPGATDEEVHQGYLDLTWVWHPDRFSGHPRLQQKAHCKLQELNEAHARLRLCHPIAHKPNLHPPTTTRAASEQPATVERLSKPDVPPSANAYEQRFVQMPRTQVRKNREVGEWLD